MTYPDPAAPTAPIRVGSPPSEGGEPDSTADAAKQEMQEMKDTASASATEVAHTAKDEAATVAAEAQTQAKDFLHRARHELADQANNQQQRAASGLRSLGDELRSMTERSDTDGPAKSLIQQAAEQTTTLADWLQDRQPGDVLNEVKRFARKRPGAFLALAAGAGLLTARLTRGLTADSNGADAGAENHAGTHAAAYYQRSEEAIPPPGADERDLITPDAPDIDPRIVPPGPGATPYPGPPAASGSTYPVPPVPSDSTYPAPPAASGSTPAEARPEDRRPER